MHIEPGLVSPEKIVLSYATASLAIGYLAKLSRQELTLRGRSSTGFRAVICTLLVFCFFEVLPHYPIGVSEVHLILGSTLFLIFGPVAASVGLCTGLLFQGLFFAPFDLPQYGMNITTLLVPLFIMRTIANKVISPRTAYIDLNYHQALCLSVTYQGGIVLWVSFWALYGRGFTMTNLDNIFTFGGAYMSVILIEPLIDLGVLACAKMANAPRDTQLVGRRLYNAA